MEPKQIDQGVRLKTLIMALNLNQPEFAKSLGMTQGYISKIVGGERSLSVEVLNRVADRYSQVNLHWLLTGVGSMFLVAPLQVNESIEGVVEGKARREKLEDRVEEIYQMLKGFKIIKR